MAFLENDPELASPAIAAGTDITAIPLIRADGTTDTAHKWVQDAAATCGSVWNGSFFTPNPNGSANTSLDYVVDANGSALSLPNLTAFSVVLASTTSGSTAFSQFRFCDDRQGNYYLVTCLENSTGVFAIRKFVNFAQVGQMYAAGCFSAGHLNVISVNVGAVSGGERVITATINGDISTQTITFTDTTPSQIAGGSVGFSASGFAYYKDLSVTSPAPAPTGASAFSLAVDATTVSNGGGRTGGTTTFTVTPVGGALAAAETVLLKDDLGNTLLTFNFAQGATAAQSQTVNWTDANVRANVLSAVASPALGTAPTVNVTVYKLVTTPSATSGADGSVINITSTLTGGTGPLAASLSGGGTLSTTAPASGTPYTDTLPASGSGVGTLSVTGPGGTSTTTAIGYSAAESEGAITVDTITPNQGGIVNATRHMLNSGSDALTDQWFLNNGLLSGQTGASAAIQMPNNAGAQVIKNIVTDATSGQTFTQSITVNTPNVTMTWQTSASCVTGGSVGIPAPVVSGSVNTATTLSGSGAPYYANGLFTPPAGAAVGQTYSITETPAANSSAAITCVITLVAVPPAQRTTYAALGAAYAGLTTLYLVKVTGYDSSNNPVLGTPVAMPNAEVKYLLGGVATGTGTYMALVNAPSSGEDKYLWFNADPANPITSPDVITALPATSGSSGASPTAVQIRQEIDSNSTQMASLVGRTDPTAALTQVLGMLGVNQALINPVLTGGVITAYDLCTYDSAAHALLNDGATGLLHKYHVALTYVGGAQNGQIVTQTS